jgi:predicted TIM-barrel fold metal-dependent hydrolase
LLPVVDAHLHVVSSDTDRYPRRPGGLGRDWWTGRPVDVEQIGRDLTAGGVDRGVIVQAVGPYRTDNRYARAAVESDPDRFALVGAIDASGADPGRELADLVGQGGVAGVRVFAAGGVAGWLTDGRGEAIWEVAAEAGVPLVAALFAEHLDSLGARMSECPDVVVALDHLAFPDLTGGPPYRESGPLFALAALPAAHLKPTTINLLTARDAGGTRALIERLVDAFGADRIAWGSDHPQSYEVPYADMVRLAHDACAGLEPAARSAVLGGTAARLWFPLRRLADA